MPNGKQIININDFLVRESKIAYTIKPISTISYNTASYLEEEIKELYQVGLISFACWIRHKGELNTQTGKRDKDHFHLYLEPSRRVAPIFLRDAFKEMVQGSDKPLGCMPFRSSNFYDWYWYALHNEKYLESTRAEEQKKEYHYATNDIHTLEDMYEILDNKIYQNPLKYTEQQKLLQVMEDDIRHGRNTDYAKLLSRVLPNSSLKNLGFAYTAIAKTSLGSVFTEIALAKVAEEEEAFKAVKEADSAQIFDDNGESIEEADLPF